MDSGPIGNSSGKHAPGFAEGRRSTVSPCKAEGSETAPDCWEMSGSGRRWGIHSKQKGHPRNRCETSWLPRRTAQSSSVRLWAPKGTSLLPLTTKVTTGNDLVPIPQIPRALLLTSSWPPGAHAPAPHPDISPMRTKLYHTAHGKWYLALRICSFSHYLLI